MHDLCVGFWSRDGFNGEWNLIQGWGTFVRGLDRVALECSVVATCCRWPPNGRQRLVFVDVFYTGKWRFWVIQIISEFFIKQVVRLFAFVDLLGREPETAVVPGSSLMSALWGTG